eukprot:CAMPEP_0184862460 /NCGR_PEP_ID=MMETSP0580-20130426/6911_1 /TAXON_ID=1118495 /ORGANISM="Dactyliosolen fragilissimus" /LENGTH=1282 /DNA_ID=CAMNT_0027360335 /DNA_START=62 /DNA_END=3910 /DNA_ORIENTATION=-
MTMKEETCIPQTSSSHLKSSELLGELTNNTKQKLMQKERRRIRRKIREEERSRRRPVLHKNDNIIMNKTINVKHTKQDDQSVSIQTDHDTWPPPSSTLPSTSFTVPECHEDSTKNDIKEDSLHAKFKSTVEMTFTASVECTSLSIPPSGRQICAGFADGTLRLFDTTSRFHLQDSNIWNSLFQNDDGKKKKKKDVYEIKEEDMSELFDCDSSESETESSPGQKSQRVPTEEHTKNDSTLITHTGVVACQIRGRGMYTSLLMDVVCSDDGLYAFGGVLRGSNEMVAVSLGELERFHDIHDNDGDLAHKNKTCGSEQPKDSAKTITDMIKIHRHSDAKLKGLGACVRIRGGLEYRLLTGKGIKNIHIWSFVPPVDVNAHATWQCLYDTPTNGNTISHLHFYRETSNGTLWGVSKSDNQRIRMWDLRDEEGQGIKSETDFDDTAQNNTTKPRKKRVKPPYMDIANTEDTIGVFGPYAFTDREGISDRVGVVRLDSKNTFNRTELALPSVNGSFFDTSDIKPSRSSRSDRKRRGLRSVVSVTGLVHDAAHVVFELSDGSLLHYSHQNGFSELKTLPDKHVEKDLMCKNNPCSSSSKALPSPIDRDRESKMCLARVGYQGTVMFASSTNNPDIGRGSVIKLMSLRDIGYSLAKGNSSSSSFWGFHGVLQNIEKCEYQRCSGIKVKEQKSPSLKNKPDSKEKRVGSQSAKFMTKHGGVAFKSPCIHKSKNNLSSIKNNKKDGHILHRGQLQRDDDVEVMEEINNVSPLECVSPFTISPNTCASKSLSKHLNDDNSSKVALVGKSPHTGDAALSTNINTYLDDICVTLQYGDSPSKRCHTNEPTLPTGKAVSPDVQSSREKMDSTYGNSCVALDGPMRKYLHTKLKPSKSKGLGNCKESVYSEEVKSTKKLLSTKGFQTKVEKNAKSHETSGTEAFHRELFRCKSIDESKLPLITNHASSSAENLFKSKAECMNPEGDIDKRSKQFDKIEKENITRNVFLTKTMEIKDDILSQRPKIPANVPEHLIHQTADKVASDLCMDSKSISSMSSNFPKNKNSILSKPKIQNEPLRQPLQSRWKSPMRKDKRNSAASIDSRSTVTNCDSKHPLSSIDLAEPSTNIGKFLAHCRARKRPRFSTMSNVLASSVASPFPPVPQFKSMHERHHHERKMMAIHHRASHERMRSRIHNVAERIMSFDSLDTSWVHGSWSSLTTSQIRDGIGGCLDNMLRDHQEMLDNMINQQRLEASSLAAQQTFESGCGLKSPVVMVSFPFPSLFEEVKLKVFDYLFGID